ncbi:hypothetical protein Agabi119p4_1394 [Agaricus bisporus var. burnettii]|uniref:Uncharacterized protein n=1 Tax=Agaricus bisporus var. burnettii TaxID=192524 RepID=A0A8H7KMU8_AGABI|nr:hypothetical protein Agabi119p4_1394 [Agaricus bisporus var. burnettii]
MPVAELYSTGSKLSSYEFFFQRVAKTSIAVTIISRERGATSKLHTVQSIIEHKNTASRIPLTPQNAFWAQFSFRT